MDNCLYYNHSKNNPEKLFDPFYQKNLVVVPQNGSTNNLITKNNRMTECITEFKKLIDSNHTINEKPVFDVVNEIVDILSTTPNINYSAFAQFFMVYNSTHSYFMSLNKKQQFEFVYEMLLRYCKERHELYLNLGYSNAILQVMCDNYSHKRNSKTTIDKILAILEPYNLKRIRSITQTDGVNYYFLPDKGDKILFEAFLKKYKLKMESRAIEQNKYPDIVFNCNGQFYICELKTMKGNGGGQNKQIVEIAYFIKFSEADSRFHYVVFLDGDYPNILFNSTMPKIVSQRNDIIAALKNNKGNYFVNTAGFIKLVNDIFK